MHPNRAHFWEGLCYIFGQWPVLRTAVLEEWGGHQSQEKADWLVGAIMEHFDERGRRVEQEELEDILLDVMGKEFNVILEDGSERVVASQVLCLFQQSIKGGTEMLAKLRAAPLAAPAAEPQIQDSSSDDDDDDDDEDVEDPRVQ